MNELASLKNKSVLVIGWEYPPRMVGGLAVATHGIVKGLSNFIHVKLIIPYKDEKTPVEDNVTVYGLNSIENDINTPAFSKLLQKSVDVNLSAGISAYPFTSKKSSSDVDLTLKGIQLKRLSYLAMFKSDEVYGWSMWEKMQAFNEVVGAMSEYLNFDLIHCHDWITFKAGMVLKKLTDKPLALHVHALETDRIGFYIRNEIYDIERRAMELADVVFPVSAYTKHCIEKHYGVAGEKIVPIHNAVDEMEFRRWRHNIPQKIVTYVGRITIQKGPGFLMETIEKVVSKYKNIRFVIAGSGDMLEGLMMHGAYAKLSKYMIFTGFIKRHQVNALLTTSDVYFMPSVSEPFGLTALEAARAGVPCVITKQSGVAEILPSALKADFWDTNKFANQIVELLTDDERRNYISEKQKEEISKVSWNASAEKIVGEYHNLLK